MSQRVVVVYCDPSQIPPDDLFIEEAPWEDIALLRTDFEIVKLQVRFDTNSQNEGRVGYVGRDVYALTHLPPGAGLTRGLKVGELQMIPKSGREQVWHQQVSPTDPPTLSISTPRLLLEETVIMGTDITLINVNPLDAGFAELSDRAQDLLAAYS